MEDELTRIRFSELATSSFGTSALPEQRLLDGDGFVPGFAVKIIFGEKEIF